MAMYDADFWEQHYRDTDPAWGTSPNQALVDTIDMFCPAAGAALELGAGHGGDALWLAGGALIIIDHGSTAPWSWSSASHAHPTPEQVANALDLGPEWNAELLETRARTATGPGGQRAEVTDTIVALRRKAV
ncbi:MAG: hypothetical protein WBF79_07945 [Rhodococcus sp. (in: high G+C Gram-positive bacteria)]